MAYSNFYSQVLLDVPVAGSNIAEVTIENWSIFWTEHMEKNRTTGATSVFFTPYKRYRTLSKLVIFVVIL